MRRSGMSHIRATKAYIAIESQGLTTAPDFLAAARDASLIRDLAPSAPTLEGYLFPSSPYLRSALMGLEEKNAPYRLAVMAMGEHRGEEHLRRHPFGRIPVLDHGGFWLYETQAILRYLDALFPQPALQPRDAQTAARMNQLVGIVDWYLFPQVTATIGFQRLIAPMLGRATDEAVITAALPNAKICFAELARLKGRHPFMAGEQISIADLMLAPQLEALARTPEGKMLLEGSPLLAWLECMLARKSMQATARERLVAGALQPA